MVMSGIDIMAHVGGLVAGLWLGFLLPPTNVPTLRSMWVRPGLMTGAMEPVFGVGGTQIIRLAGIVALLGFFAVLAVVGFAAWG